MYIRKEIVEKAKRHIQLHKCSMDYQLSRYFYLEFGLVGLTLVHTRGKKVFRKHINGWRDKSISELNAALKELNWEVMYG